MIRSFSPTYIRFVTLRSAMRSCGKSSSFLLSDREHIHSWGGNKADKNVLLWMSLMNIFSVSFLSIIPLNLFHFSLFSIHTAPHKQHKDDDMVTSSSYKRISHLFFRFSYGNDRRMRMGSVGDWDFMGCVHNNISVKKGWIMWWWQQIVCERFHSFPYAKVFVSTEAEVPQVSS